MSSIASDVLDMVFKKKQLLAMGAEPLSKTEFRGYLKLERDGWTYVYEPENASDVENIDCLYLFRNKFRIG
jgi:hypothetical protein